MNFLTMKTITINVPNEADEKDLQMAVAVRLYEKGILSSGRAAELVGISKRDFIENLGEYNVSAFGETVDDLKKAIEYEQHHYL